jgi:hypothetical protein
MVKKALAKSKSCILLLKFLPIGRFRFWNFMAKIVAIVFVNNILS